MNMEWGDGFEGLLKFMEENMDEFRVTREEGGIVDVHCTHKVDDALHTELTIDLRKYKSYSNNTEVSVGINLYKDKGVNDWNELQRVHAQNIPFDTSKINNNKLKNKLLYLIEKLIEKTNKRREKEANVYLMGIGEKFDKEAVFERREMIKRKEVSKCILHKWKSTGANSQRCLKCGIKRRWDMAPNCDGGCWYIDK